jgi:aminopeptidase N
VTLRTYSAALAAAILVSQGLWATTSTAASPVPLTASGTSGAPGAPGAGDPYFPYDGNGGFDVDHYGLNLHFWPQDGRLSGTATIDAHSTQGLSRFDLDFQLHATSVSVNGRRAAFHTEAPHELVIHPAAVIPRHSAMRVVVSYTGFPGRIKAIDGGNRWRATKGSVFVNGEPHGATLWFPLSDHPSDKATYDVRVLVPATWKAVSAGKLVAHRVSGIHSMWHWQVTKPMASYLAFLGMGTYRMLQGTAGGHGYTYAWSTLFSTPMQQAIQTALARTPSYVAWLSARLGGYPFDHIGGTVPGGFAVPSIESQSAPVYSRSLFQTPSAVPGDMVRELAHQWLGDSVTIERWRDLWLSEGIATYMQWWYAADHGGLTLNRRMLTAYHSVPRDSPWWSIRPGNPGPGKTLFTSVYARGAMTVQALENVVGASHLHRLLRTWVKIHEYGNATTHQFIDLAQRISGRKLTRFFQVWLYDAHRPPPTAANGFPRGHQT